MLLLEVCPGPLGPMQDGLPEGPRHEPLGGARSRVRQHALPDLNEPLLELRGGPAVPGGRLGVRVSLTDRVGRTGDRQGVALPVAVGVRCTRLRAHRHNRMRNAPLLSHLIQLLRGYLDQVLCVLGGLVPHLVCYPPLLCCPPPVILPVLVRLLQQLDGPLDGLLALLGARHCICSVCGLEQGVTLLAGREGMEEEHVTIPARMHACTRMRTLVPAAREWGYGDAGMQPQVQHRQLQQLLDTPLTSATLPECLLGAQCVGE